MTPADIIQLVVAVAAVGAAIIALVISAKDRQNAREIARADRKIAMLTRELDLALRLTENRAYGGSSDKLVRERLGSEALALVGILGKERVPKQWARKVELDDDGLRGVMNDSTTVQWVQDKIEAQLAVSAISNEIAARLRQ
jgi:hypothetical protein